MKITLLGTGADHCIPAFRCTCGVCTEARQKRGKYIRQNSCALIESEDEEALLIDMPPQILLLLAHNGVDDEKIRTILVTHRHADHTLGLRYFFHASVKKEFKIAHRAELFISSSALDAVSKKILSQKKETLFAERKDFYGVTIVRNAHAFTRGEWDITPVETGHLSAKPTGNIGDESLGYIIKDGSNKTCVYLLDAASNLPNETIALLQSLEIDCLIGDCTYEKTTEISGHMDIRALVDLTKELHPKRTIASHISHMNLPYTELEKRLKEYSIDIGYDGMELNV